VKRRTFIAGLGSAVAWPLAVSAQQGDRVRRIGVLTSLRTIRMRKINVATFVQMLQQLGWAEGRNVRIDIRWAEGDAAEIRRHAADLVALAPDVIVSTGTAVRPSLICARPRNPSSPALNRL